MMLDFVRQFAEDEGGATAIEYALLASMLFVGAMAALEAMSASLVKSFETVAGYLSSAAGG